MNSSPEALNQLETLIKTALNRGADAADAILVDEGSVSVSWRGGRLETLERSESGDMGLRVFVGKKQAIVSSTDRDKATLDNLVDRAIAMAKAAPEDAFCGLAEPEQLAKTIPSVEMADDTEIEESKLINMAKEIEAAALSVPGVSQCESSNAGTSSNSVALVASNGFSGHYRRTGFGISASVLAASENGMEQDYDFSSTVFASDLENPSLIGRRAGERAVKRLNARKMPTAKVPVIFEKRIAGSLVGHLSDAISGPEIARGTSFLNQALGKQIFSKNITIVDDPFRARGLRSRAFDAEGLLPQKLNIVDKGVLTTWLLDLRSARQLGMKSTAHASRGTSSNPYPSPTNLYMEAGNQSPHELMDDIKQGFYVTELMGDGLNEVTGDYSFAASGFWIENGQLAFPVNEMTVAGNLKDMFMHLSAANDLEFKRGVDTPTLRIDGMTVAGV